MMSFDSRSSSAALHGQHQQHQHHQQQQQQQQQQQHRQEQKLRDQHHQHQSHPTHPSHDPHHHHSPPLQNGLDSSAMMTDTQSSFLYSNPPPQQQQQPPVTVGLSAPGMPGGLSAAAGPQVAGTPSAAVTVSGAPMVTMGSHYGQQSDAHLQHQHQHQHQHSQQHQQHQQHPHPHPQQHQQHQTPHDPHHHLPSHPPMATGMAPPSLSPLTLSTPPQRRESFINLSGSATAGDEAVSAAAAAAVASANGRRRTDGMMGSCAEAGQALVDQSLGQGMGPVGLGQGLGQPGQHAMGQQIKMNQSMGQGGLGQGQRRTSPPVPRTSVSSGSSVSSSSKSSTGPERPQFSTQVDILMRTIQLRPDEAASEPRVTTPGRSFSQHPSPIHMPVGVGSPEEEMYEPVSKPYNCNFGNCTMSFWQKTHLDIHKRSHTGEKPYRCSYSGCEAQFSQLGNLRTHERRHTGEKPFSCDRCGKFFAQRGNLKAHLKTHLRQQPYECRLDSCKKRFTQLGNMKAHQNKYHANSLAILTTKFAKAGEGDEEAAASITPEDRELFQHFADLYKNSNKGIKGRGKHRRVRPLATASVSTAEGLSSAPTVPETGSASTRRSRMGTTRNRGNTYRNGASSSGLGRRSNMRNAGPSDMQHAVPAPPLPPQPSQVAQHMPTSASPADSYMLYHPPLLHPIPPPPGAYGQSLGKLVNAPSVNNSPVGTPGSNNNHGHGGPGASDGTGGPYDHHSSQQSSLPPAPPTTALHPPQIPMNHQYSGQAPMGHGGMSSSQHQHAQHPQHAAPQHPGHHMQSSHGGALHSQPMHSVGVPPLVSHVPQHHGQTGPSGPGGQHGHMGQMSHAAVVTRPPATAGFAYDNERTNQIYNGVF